MEDDPDVPEAPDLDMLVSIALKERGQHIVEVEEGLDQHARGAVLGEQVGLGVRVETVDLEDSTIEDRVEREGGASGEVQISLAWRIETTWTSTSLHPAVSGFTSTSDAAHAAVSWTWT